MRRPVMVLVALAWAAVLSGCPAWSRPDPALKREVVPAPVTPPTPERLHTLGSDLLYVGSETEQAEVEALLQELSDLRAELVDRARGK